MHEITGLWAIKTALLQHLGKVHAGSVGEQDVLTMHTDQPTQSGRGYEMHDGVAVIRLNGVLLRHERRSGLFDVTSTTRIGESLRRAVTDASIRAIVLAIHSPGGTVDGTQELARQIYTSRLKKPIVAYAEGLMASAAYWIGAAADQVFISSDTTELGSIGVVASHIDISKAEDARGITTTEIVAGRYKRVASMHRPLSDLGRSMLQDQVDHVYGIFIHDISVFRGVPPDTVVRQMADGRIFIGQRAIAAGLADGKTTLDALMTHLRTSTSSVGARAQALIATFKRDASLRQHYGSLDRYAEATDPCVFHGYDRQLSIT